MPTRSFEVQTDPVNLPDVPVKIKKKSRIMYPSRSLAEQSRKTSLPALPLRAISFPEADVTPLVEIEVDDPEPSKLVAPPTVEEVQSPAPPTPEPVKPQLESKPALARRHNLEGRNDFYFYSQYC